MQPQETAQVPLDAPGGAPGGTSRRLLLLRVGFLAVLLALGALLARSLLAEGFTVEVLRREVAAYGAWAPLVYVGLFAAATVLMLPGSVLSVGAGLLFGLGVGLPVALAGAMLGATAAFAVARWAGGGFVEALLGKRAEALLRLISEEGLSTVLVVRLIPLSPFFLLNYAFGLTRVRTRDYVLGTFLGVLPSVLLLVATASAVVTVRSAADVLTLPVLLPSLGLVALTAGTLWLARRERRRRGGSPGAP